MKKINISWPVISTTNSHMQETQNNMFFAQMGLRKMMGSWQARLFVQNFAARLFDFATVLRISARPPVRPPDRGPGPLGPGPGPKHLGDIDNFITKQEPKDYTLREILNIKNIIRQEPIS